MSKFFAGNIFMLGVVSLSQDIMGKEAYIEHVTNHWVDGWVTIPIALVCIVYSVCIAYAE